MLRFGLSLFLFSLICCQAFNPGYVQACSFELYDVMHLWSENGNNKNETHIVLNSTM
jgi:hypothetical protein